ncbi:MAG: hypothetical protein AAF184_16680 [Pseudomonadota bacterium]
MNISRTVTPPRRSALTMAALLLLITAHAFAQGGEDSLTLRLADASATPGGIVAVVMRTYSSRGVGQGQVCMPIRQQPNGPMDQGGANPIAAVLASVVFSRRNDANFQTELDQASQSVMLTFDSPTASINEVDGPLAVIYLRLRSDLIPGQEYEIALDLPDSFLVDADGAPITIEGRAGRLRIDGPAEPFSLSAAAEATVPGRTALLSAQSEQLRLLAAGRVALRYDPLVADGTPQVRIDPRYGTGDFNVSGSDPDRGLVIVNFVSPARDLNRVTGDFIQVLVPTRADIPVGTESPVRLDPALSFLVGRTGQVLTLELDDDDLEFIR